MKSPLTTSLHKQTPINKKDRTYIKRFLSILLVLITNVVFSQSYHDTQGKLEISSMGNATYTLPIALPPSISSVGPTINLVYASGQQGGIAGQGWNINSISNIVRTATRNDIDGFKDGVDFDDNDKLSLDGQRLLLKTGTYWADGSTYETEVQSNTKIELIGTGSNIYFIVTTPDGSRSWYGNYGGVNATDLTAFYLTRFEDAEGNFINYVYSTLNSNSIYINEIQFSANTNSNVTPLNKIVFTYEDAKRKETAYIKGLKIEKNKILKRVQVFTNELLFKDYQLTHQIDSLLGYQRVIKIQEYNGAEEMANPVEFEYDTTTSTNVGSETTKSYTNNISFNNAKIGGDFDGDGRLDFIADNNLYTKVFDGNSGANSVGLPFSCTDRTVFAATVKDGTKLNQFQSIVKVTENQNSINFGVYNFQNGLITNNFIKSIDIDNRGFQTSYCINPEGAVYYTAKTNNKFLEGDFNGDGISEVLLLTYYDTSSCYLGYEVGNNGQLISNCKCYPNSPSGIKDAHIIDLDPNSSVLNNTAGNFTLDFVSLSLLQIPNAKLFINDFNGDGKADILQISDTGAYKLISFKQLNVTPWVELEIIGQGTLANYSTNKQLFFGDFNGDGKTDLLLPYVEGNGCEDWANNYCQKWALYFSNPKITGGEMFEFQEKEITHYMPIRDNYSMSTISNSYFVLDVNKDGKSDLVRVERTYYKPSWTINDHDTSWNVSSYVNNLGVTGVDGFTADYVSPCYTHTYTNYTFTDCFHNSDNNWFPIPIASNYQNKGINNELVMVTEQNNYLTYINFTKDFNRDNSLKKVTQSNGAIIDEISYSPMQGSASNSGYGSGIDKYSSNNSVDYPFVEIKQVPTISLVTGLKNTTMGVTRFQSFKYKGYVAQMGGIGVIGFRKTARSSWYKNTSDKITWAVAENDPLKRGATTNSYSVMLNSNVDFNFDTSYTNLINRVETDFTQSTDAVTKKYSILMQKQKSTDFLTNVITENLTEYSTEGYLLPKKTTTNKYLGTTLQGTTTTITDYDDPSLGTGSNYYIGRPHKITTISTAYGTTKKASQTISYSNSNISQIDKNVYVSDGTLDPQTLDPITMVEKMNYYPNGLLMDKETSATGTTAGVNDVSPRKVSYTYDPTNRFISTVTDPELLVSTNTSFHPLYGTVLVATNPFGQTVTSVYDNWGKRTSVTDNTLGTNTNYAYSRSGTIYTTTITNNNGSGISDGSSTIIEQDVLARETRKGTKNLNGTWTYVATEYDAYGRKYRTSEPYFSGSSPAQLQWTVYEYDDYSRPIKTTFYTGKIVNTSYTGLTVTASDTVMSKSKTMDANGQVISATDAPGGTILYKYDANFNLLESNYGGIKTTMTYDNWGRKNYYKETSEGVFTYTYNAYGELKTEVAPKGTTTYTYDPVSGRIVTKSVVGITTADGTNITSTYNYNPTTKLLDNITVTNPNDGNSKISYSYDNFRRLYKTEEFQNNISATVPAFKKELTFDSFNRVDVETNTATAFGKTSAKAIKHSYSTNNGAENQLKDNATSTNLWLANTVDARGNILTATLGNGIAITNTFDNYGYAFRFQHKLGTTNVMTLNTTFEPVLGNLTNRYNSMFDVQENFSYDSQDRLLSWDASGDNLLNLPFNDSIEEFVFTSDTPTISGSVSNVSGTLKVYLKNGSASRPLTEVAVTTGNKLRIKADITNKTGTTGVLVNAIMVEADPDNPTSTNEVFLGVVENGTLDTEYLVSEYFSNPNLSLKFVIDESSVNNSSGSNTTIFDGDGNILTPLPPSVTFYVDNLKIDNVVVSNQNYDNRGRITDNKLGYYNYSATKPYQNTTINPAPDTPRGVTRTTIQSITYNAFKAPIQIISVTGNTKVNFGYNNFEQRSVMYYGSYAADKLARPYRRYYSADGSMEINATFAANNTTTPTAVEFVTYVGGTAYNAPVVLKSNGTNYNYFYLHRDYQGSILAITNSVGAVVEKRLFDPWGAVTKVQDGAGNTLTKMAFFDRGYTGHEHLQDIELINMNARLYSPYYHRFLEADNVLQDSFNTQNYNKYGYCLNNPLKYTDPSGNIAQIAIAVIVAVAVAVTSYTVTALLADVPFTVGGLLQSAVISAASAVVTFGIGSACSTIGNFYLRAGVSALAHGTFQGGMTAATGGKFWAGFAAGAVSSLAASSWQGGDTTTEYCDGKFGTVSHQGISGAVGGNNAVGTIAFGTVMGGAGSALAGGNFWQGAVTGLFVSTFNDVMHSNMKRKDLVARMKKGNIDPSGKPDFTQAGVDKMNNGVEGLDEEYRAGGSPKVSFDSTNSKEGGHTDPRHVHLNPSKITNNYRYASVLFHEYRHAWQWIYKYDTWCSEHYNNAKIVEALMERDAYGHTIQIGIYSPYNPQDSIIKENFDINYNFTKFIKHF